MISAADPLTFDDRFENDGIPAQISDEAADILADLFLAIAEINCEEQEP